MRTFAAVVVAVALLAPPAASVAAPCITLSRDQATRLRKAAGRWKGVFLWTEKSGLPMPTPAAWPAEGTFEVKEQANGSATFVVDGTPRDLAEVWVAGLSDAAIDNAAALVGCKVLGVPRQISEKTPGRPGERFRELLAAAENEGPAPAAAPEIIRTMSISSRGVAFDLDVDGKVSELLSCSSTGSSAGGFPIDRMGLPVGSHVFGISVRKVEGEDAFLRITLQESARGEMVDTSAEGMKRPPFPIELVGPQLRPGAKHSFTFATIGPGAGK